MKNYSRSIVTILVILFVLIPLIYSLRYIYDVNYVRELMSNWFSMMVGIIIGIPIALEINRFQQKKQQQIEINLRKIENINKISFYIDRVFEEILCNLQNRIGQTCGRPRGRTA
jgi:hypothetical protein